MLDHKWIANRRNLSTTSQPLSPEEHKTFVGTIKAFSKMNKFQTGVISLLSNLTASEEDLKNLKKMFQDLDKDKDGKLSIEEVKMGLEKLMHPEEKKEGDHVPEEKKEGDAVPKKVCSKHPPDEYKKLVESMDRNGDGEITWDEFVAASIDKIALLNKHNIRAAFNVLDENGDGKISREELKKWFKADENTMDPDEKMWDEIMNQVDEDRCGAITWTEF